MLAALWIACSTPEPVPHGPPAAAWIPPQCYAATRRADGGSRDPCWTCHQRPRLPNFVDDEDLQLEVSLPGPATTNPWTRLRGPSPVLPPDDEVRAWVRADNYHDERGGIGLIPADLDGDGRWAGYTPDAWLHADDRGWDRGPDGVATGWRAYAYWPVPGAFWPTNGGGMGDAWIRLPAPFRTRGGAPDDRVAELNLALLEALITFADVPVDSVDEAALGVDLDRDGVLAVATRVSTAGWDPARGVVLRWVGDAGDAQDRGELGPPTPGLYPEGAELLHTIRYLDLTGDGRVRMAPRVAEVRYARKDHAQTYGDLQFIADRDAHERELDADGLRKVTVDAERGAYTGTGWRVQGWIEAADGTLRPQTPSETTFCVGCHGGIGATTDSTFSLARKIPGDAGWRHAEDAYGLPDRVRADGRGEAALYLETTRSGDDFAANDEIRARFFAPDGRLDPVAVAGLARDLSPMILPTPARALRLDALRMASVRDQAFDQGRDAAAALGDDQLLARIDQGTPTGVADPVKPGWVRP